MVFFYVFDLGLDLGVHLELVLELVVDLMHHADCLLTHAILLFLSSIQESPFQLLYSVSVDQFLDFIAAFGPFSPE